MSRSLTAEDRKVLSAAIDDCKYIDDPAEKASFLVDVLRDDCKWDEDEAVELASWIVYENKSADPFRLLPVAWDEMPRLAGAWA